MGVAMNERSTTRWITPTQADPMDPGSCPGSDRLSAVPEGNPLNRVVAEIHFSGVATTWLRPWVLPDGRSNCHVREISNLGNLIGVAGLLESDPDQYAVTPAYWSG